jgi:hypothetical protein
MGDPGAAHPKGERERWTFCDLTLPNRLLGTTCFNESVQLKFKGVSTSLHWKLNGNSSSSGLEPKLSATQSSDTSSSRNFISSSKSSNPSRSQTFISSSQSSDTSSSHNFSFFFAQRLCCSSALHSEDTDRCCPERKIVCEEKTQNKTNSKHSSQNEDYQH